jgi:hypothetical protein
LGLGEFGEQDDGFADSPGAVAPDEVTVGGRIDLGGVVGGDFVGSEGHGGSIKVGGADRLFNEKGVCAPKGGSERLKAARIYPPPRACDDANQPC